MTAQPLPDPETLPSEDRVRIINQIREEKMRGVAHDEATLRWATRLIQVERQANSSRASRTREPRAPKKKGPIEISLEDL